MRETQVGDYGKLDYRVEQWEPSIFRKVFHRNGFVKAIRKEYGETFLDVWFCNGVMLRDVRDYYFDNFTKRTGYLPPEEWHLEDGQPINESDCDPTVSEVIKRMESDFYSKELAE